MKTFRIVLAATLLAVPTLRAQIIADSASLTLSNVTNSFPGDLIIGTNGSFTLLVLSDNALMGNSGNGIIGLNSTAKSNEVRLISPTAYWFVATNLFVGSNGAFNRLTISNGALVETKTAFIGGFHFLGSNNEAVVTGAGSLWTNSGLSIGVVSPGNRLMISNGGRVSSGAGLLGVADPRDASNNTALVTGAGSTWNNQGGLDIGYSGSSCRLVISNAAFVDNALGRIGHGASGLSASNCEAVVTGSGSVWSNRTGLLVGEFGHAARLVVTNGGAVIALGDVLLGRPFSSTNNRIVVGGSTLMATNVAGTAALSLLCGTNQFNAGVIEADFLRMGNTLGLFEFNGGLLTTRGAFISNSAPFVVGGPGNIPAIWDVRAGVSNYFLSSDLYVGSNSSLNQLVITNGALLNNNAGILGSRTGANSNLAMVAGMNSVWNNRADLDVGLSGARNQLVVTNGGVVRNNYGILGANSGSSNNVALVADSGSVWTNANDVYVGRSGAGNQLLVSNGGVVRNNDGYLGVNTGSSNNLTVVTGLGSVWNNAGALFLGQDDQGNRLVVSNAGVVLDSSGYFGLNTGSSNNVAVVTGPGSTWTNAQDFYLGFSSARNQLVVTNGATVFVGGNGVLGRNSAANSNSVSVTDPGTSWLLASNVYVGTNGSFNQLVVSNGGLVANNSGIIGSSATSSNNLALVTGAGSVWSNASVFGFYVGLNGRGNQLVVSNGAVVYVGGNGAIGANSGAISNSLLLTDAGTRWQMAPGAVLNVGSNSSFNRLVLSNGAVANCQDGYLGRTATSGTNEAVVTGLGSAWNVELTLFLGLGGGVGNRLTVANGGVVNSRLGQLVSSNCEAIVTGPGSAWTNGQDLYVGFNAGGNRLVISNGGLVVNSNAVFLGFNSGSVNNRLIVDGGTLRVARPFGFALLGVQRGTNVLNAGLIEADHLQLTNALGRFEFNGGLLSSRNSTVNNGQLFRVGNGVSLATFNLAGDGVHAFFNGLSVSSNAMLTGNGYLGGMVTVSNGGAIAPGASIGKIILENSPSLQGAVLMEISKNGATLSNDQIQVVAPLTLTYGGSLTVSDIGPTALAAGDNFRLFVASSYAGSFSSITLPVLGPELIWTNKLLVDGSIEVISIPPGDHFWTNALGGNYNVPVNWLPNSVPGQRDNAVFTNNAGYQVAWPADASAANAYFNARSGTVTQAIGAAAWSLTNTYIVGNDSVATAAVTHVSGVLRVTNSAGEARLVIGGSGRGTYNLNGGDVTVDYLFGTNNGPGFTNSIFAFNFGNLTTLQGSVVTQNTSFVIGNVSNQTATWTMPRGTNVIALDNSSQTILGNLPGSRGVVVASGGSTVWSHTSSLVIGGNSSASQLLVTDGAKALSLNGEIGSKTGSTNNVATITGSGSLWSNQFGLLIGNQGSGNRLVVSNGGLMHSIVGQIGVNNSSGNNEAVVTGLGSVWTIPSTLYVGNLGNGNRLVVSNGGQVESFVAFIGLNTFSSNNEALVTGAGSIWNCPANLNVGYLGSGNRLVVSNEAVISTDGIIVGSEASSTNNRMVLDGGTLRATDVLGMGVLDVRRGTNVLNAGLIEVDQLLLTNTQGKFEFNGGTLSVKSSRVTVGNPLRIGNGVSPATWLLAGNGTHDFSGTLGLLVSSNATFTGNGTLIGQLLVQNGGMVVPGTSVGKIVLSNSPSLQGAIIMEISKNGATLTNDQIQVVGPLTYGGTLTVTNLGPTALVASDGYQLFSATSYSGSFSAISLPPLGPGLTWTNKLLLDGSIQVVGTAQPVFSTITLSGTNVVINGTNGTPGANYAVLTATNITIPSSNWVSIATNQFDLGGAFSFTNTVAPGEPQRYFRIRTP